MRWVSPFGHFRVKACCQLTGTFRRLPRPSSPLTAKASTVCAYSLDHITPSRLGVIVSLRLLASTTRLVRQNQNACLRPKLSKNAMRTATSHRNKTVMCAIQRNGGSGRTRTTGLTLIRGAL